MTQIYWSYEPRQHINGTSSIHADDSELDVTCKQLLKGTNSHLSDLLPRAWEWFDIPMGDFIKLDMLNEKTFEKIHSGQSISIFENPTYAQAVLTLGDFLALSVLWEKLAQDALCADSFSDFVTRHTLSVSLYRTFTEHLGFLSATAEDQGSSLDSLMHEAVTANCAKASQEAAKRHREIKAKAIEMYRSGNYKSKNQAAEKIAALVGRTVAVVRGWLQGI